MKMETAGSSETSVHISQTKKRDIYTVELWEVHGTVVLPVLAMKQSGCNHVG
jgi:hypothetical protein